MCRPDNDSMDLSVRSVAKQRTLEIAKRGFSEMALPKKSKKKQVQRFSQFDRRDNQYTSAMSLIADAFKEEQDSRHRIEFKIRHDARMAEHRLMRGNDDGACLAMSKVVTVQYEYVHVLRRIAAIKELRSNVENGYTECIQVKKNLDEIFAIRGAPDEQIEFDPDELLDELEDGNFFPILNTDDGSISFTDNYDYASSADFEDYDEEDIYGLAPRSISSYFGSPASTEACWEALPVRVIFDQRSGGNIKCNTMYIKHYDMKQYIG